MLFVVLRVNEKAASLLIQQHSDTHQLRTAIAQAVPGEIDPFDGIELDIVRRDILSHSRYDMTIHVEAMDTAGYTVFHDEVARTIWQAVTDIFDDKLMVHVKVNFTPGGYA